MTTQTTGTLQEWLAGRLKSVGKDPLAVSRAYGPRDTLARWVFFVDCERLGAPGDEERRSRCCGLDQDVRSRAIARRTSASSAGIVNGF
jgi:hypothetical protein